MALAPRKKPIKTALLCPCRCGVALFPGDELDYASHDCLYRLHEETPSGDEIPRSSPSLYIKRGREKGKVGEQGESSSRFITPGEIPAPPPPIVFPSQYAKDADTAERLRKHDIFMEYATVEEIMAFQRGMIKAGLMEEAADASDHGENLAPPQTFLRPAASTCQIRWAVDMLRQYPHKSKAQIARENHTSWEQLCHWAHSSTDGLPERASQKVREKVKRTAAKAPAAKVVKAKSAPKPKAKEA